MAHTMPATRHRAHRGTEDLLLLRLPAAGPLLLGLRPRNAQSPPPVFPTPKTGAWDLAGNLAANFKKEKKEKEKKFKAISSENVGFRVIGS